MGGKSKHLTFEKKNPTPCPKTYLLSLETGRRIFGTMSSTTTKNRENLLRNNFKMTPNLLGC
jgi:hypothetical protein